MGLSVNRLDAFADTCNLRYSNTIKTVNGNNFATREAASVDHQFNRVVHRGIQFDHGTDSELDDVFQQHFGFTEADRDGELNVQQRREVRQILDRRIFSWLRVHAIPPSYWTNSS